MPRLGSLLSTVLAIVLLLGLGVYAGRAWFPRVQEVRVDHEIVKIVEKIVPGQPVTVYKWLTKEIRVPIEVTRFVDRPGPERIVTVTKPVNVPFDVFPQTITVKIGGVQTTAGEWVVPKVPNLVIGLVAAGVYAAPVQDGWSVTEVRTETKMEDQPAATRARLGIFPVGVSSFPDVHLVSELTYQNAAWVGTYEVRVAYHWSGGLSGDLRWGVAW